MTLEAMAMALRAVAVSRSGVWSGSPVETVVLDFDGRHRRRVTLTGEGGLEFLLDLPEVPSLRDGDGLVLEDGRVVLVKAADEVLMEIAANGPEHLARLAWHLGNRHLPTQILDGALRIRADHVIADMAVKLGARVAEITAPFEPEGGAYGHGRTHGQDHHHG